MLRRQRILLSMLREAGRPVRRTPLVELAFLLSRETDIPARLPFYDFLPYRYGPFSFLLYRELQALAAAGHVENREGGLTASRSGVASSWSPGERALDPASHAVPHVLARYGGLSRSSLIDYVYRRYPWYASRSTADNRAAVPSVADRPAELRVYTIGYAGRSVDALFDELLRLGIAAIADVRANPISRKYGLSKGRLAGIATRLGMTYVHAGALGIPSARRRGSGPGDRVALLDEYEREILPRRAGDVAALADMFRRTPSVLLCAEADPAECHRTRLAKALSAEAGLAVQAL